MTDLGFPPAVHILGAAGFIWLMTTLGSAIVFFFKSFGEKLHAIILGSTAGIMTAASFWSLLEPSISLSVSRGGAGWTAASAGIAAGTLFLAAADALTEKIKGERGSLLMLSVTVHNIPEGLAVGVAFGLIASGAASAAAAWGVAVG
ncbi:MAG: ZIP family metal transporter, partial [Clostridia bacterium]|nr:ZIP family metal transporter [Clostridia bacterium]